MIKELGKYVIMFVVLVLAQVAILNNIQVSGFINPYIYILFILLLPFSTPGYLLLLLSFLIGITVDIFSNTPGINAGASVLLGFARPGLARLVTSREIIEKGGLPGLNQIGFSSFLKYVTFAVLIHHFFLFFAEAFSLTDIPGTILRIILSSIFSIVVILGSQFIIFKN
jgi:rod shape-determining protein MreD